MGRIPAIRQGIARASCPTQNGPDTEDSILCLSPNHHTLYDLGAFTLADDFTPIGAHGRLHVGPNHRIDPGMLEYRRNHYGGTEGA